MLINPFQSLNHDTVLDIIEETIHQKLTNLFLPRNSYINRVYELELADSRERIIVKFYRPNRWTKAMIQTEHDFVSTLEEFELPVISPQYFHGQTLHTSTSDIHFTVYPKKGGRAINEFDRDLWEELGRTLARMHTIGAKWQDPNRIKWIPDIASKEHIETLQSTNVIPTDFRMSFNRAISHYFARVSPLFNDLEVFLIHGDCHRGNFIHRPGEGLFIVDFDDIVVGPPVQDLWMLLPDIPENCQQEIGWFFQGYDLFREFPKSTIKLIPALRGMRLIHFAAWCATQAQEPHFQQHFPEWGTNRYWNELIRDLLDICGDLN